MTKATPPSFVEFVILVSLMFSLIAFGTDAMLPSLPAIASSLQLSDVNQAQLIVTTFVLGTGLGQLFFGPMSDATGRKPAIAAGILLFIAGCVMCYFAQSILGMLIGRFIQGLGISAPRTVTIALVRDLYKGREMARVMSFSFGIFVLVPAVAPMIGQTIMGAYGWRSIFLSFILFASVALIWMWMRQIESHPVEKRRLLKGRDFLNALTDVLRSRTVLVYMAIQGLLLGGLFGYLSSAQQIYVDSFGVGDRFPLYFALVTLISGLAAFVNGTLVIRLGMRTMCKSALILAVVSAGIALAFQTMAPVEWRLAGFIIWSILAFMFMSLTLGNVNALAMEPMGHIAGLASAVIGAAATLLAVLIAVPIGLAFAGSPMPLIFSHMMLYALAFWLMHFHAPKETL
ncbi:MAG: multidrug effflux MFS transporter [Rhodobacteraceae bacterium]|nr:multidrug effflux MFS transporter [Paracoccaceae bacterium]